MTCTCDKDPSVTCPIHLSNPIPTISPYHAKYSERYDSTCFFSRKPIKITAYQYLGKLIDSEWKHSWYWDSQDHNKFISQAKEDLKTEKEKALERLEELQEAERLIKQIQPEIT